MLLIVLVFHALASYSSDFFNPSQWNENEACYESIKGAVGSPAMWEQCCENDHTDSKNCQKDIYDPSEPCFHAITNNDEDVHDEKTLWYTCCDQNCLSSVACLDNLYCPNIGAEVSGWPIWKWLSTAIGIIIIVILVTLCVLVCCCGCAICGYRKNHIKGGETDRGYNKKGATRSDSDVEVIVVHQ